MGEEEDDVIRRVRSTRVLNEHDHIIHVLRMQVSFFNEVSFVVNENDQVYVRVTSYINILVKK